MFGGALETGVRDGWLVTGELPLTPAGLEAPA
jgi:hypothetical protein